MQVYEMKTDSLLNHRYRIYRSLGQGGFGITYVAQDETLGQDVVVKEYFPVSLARRTEDGVMVQSEGEEAQRQYEEGMKRFLNEAQILASLFDVPGVVKVLDYFKENHTAYIVMEYVKGISLRSYLERQEKDISFEQACEMLKPVMNALEKIHKKGLVHRDINPDNLMVEEDGTIKMLDFGAAREYFLEQDREKTMTILVKNGYAPPEQYESHSKQGPWTDIYALCATMYEMMTGCMPPSAKERQVADELYPPSTFGAVITAEQEEAFIRKGLALEPEDRFRSITRLKEEFFPEEKQKKVKASRRNHWIIALLIVIAGCIAGRIIYQNQNQKTEEPAPYAGNYERGSKEYKDFLAFVKKHAKAKEKDGDSTVYTLSEKAVRTWGQRSNEYLFDYKYTDILEMLEQDGYHMTHTETDGDYRVTVEPYGVLKTGFHKRITYQTENQVVVRIVYDLISEQVYYIYVYPEIGSEGDICPVMADLFLSMGYKAEGTRDELIQAARNQTEIFYNHKMQGEEGWTSGFDLGDFGGLYLVIPDTDNVIGFAFMQKTPNAMMDIPPYDWP